MNVSILIYNYALGGIHTFAKNLADELSENYPIELSIYVYIPESVAANFDTLLQPNAVVHTAYKNKMVIRVVNIVNHIFNLFATRNWFREKVLDARFKRFIKKHKIDLVHSNFHDCDRVALDVSEIYNIPTVITDHGSYRAKVLSEGIMLQMQRICKVGYAMAFLTDQTQLNFKTLTDGFHKKFVFKKIYNGFNLNQKSDTFSQLSGLKPDDFVFGMIARGIPEKGWQQAINAFIQLHNCIKKTALKLVLCGDGDYLKDLKDQYQGEPNILFLGASKYPLQVISQIDCSLFPSYFPAESMPFSIIECLACDVPIIATDNGAIQEMITVENEIAGSLIPMNEDGMPNEILILEEMKKYICDPEFLKKKKGLASKAKLKFDARKMAKEYYEIYQQIASFDGV